MLGMLRTAGGTTIDAIVKATDWQQHSVRGFLAGVVRRKLQLILVSEPADGGRVYRITDKAMSATVVKADHLKATSSASGLIAKPANAST